MTSLPKSIPHLGLYLYTNAVDDIAGAHGLDETAKSALMLEMAAAIRARKLQVRDPVTGAPFHVTPSMDDPSSYVTLQDVNTWLEADGRNYKWIPSTDIKPRMTVFRAFLQDCFQSGVEKNIESVWQYMRSNAGKDNFLFRAVSNTTATTVDGKRVNKDNLARTLARLIN